MDANLDFCKWTRDDLPPSDSTSRLRTLIDLLFTKILPHGVSQLVTVPTRAWPGQTEAGLDHIYTNKPDKLSNVYAEFAGGSDHKLIKVTRYAKSTGMSEREVSSTSRMWTSRLQSRRCHGGTCTLVNVQTKQPSFSQTNLMSSLTPWLH